MRPPLDAEPLAQARDALRGIQAGIRELDRLCREATALLDRLSAAAELPATATSGRGEPAPEPAPSRAVALPAGASARPGLDAHQGALLVAVTLRGGTVDAGVLTRLASDLGVGSAALDELFAGFEPHLVRRAGGTAGITERGLESATGWRPALPLELVRLATDL